MMKKITLTLALVFGILFSNAQALDEDKIDVSLTLNLDAFFGFAPMMTFSYALS